MITKHCLISNCENKVLVRMNREDIYLWDCTKCNLKATESIDNKFCTYSYSFSSLEHFCFQIGIKSRGNVLPASSPLVGFLLARISEFCLSETEAANKRLFHYSGQLLNPIDRLWKTASEHTPQNNLSQGWGSKCLSSFVQCCPADASLVALWPAMHLQQSEFP